MSSDEFNRILIGLGFEKVRTEKKKPLTSPYSREGMPITLVTYTHANVKGKKLKVQVSERLVLAVWSDEGKKPITAWVAIHDLQELKQWARLSA